MNGDYRQQEITMEVERELGVLSEKRSGWSKRVKVVSWCGGRAKLDIRDWNDNTGKCGKGISLTWDEALVLYRILGEMYEKDARR